MTLPASRDLTFAALSQVPSATLNRIQDCIIQGAHGDVELWIPASAMLSDVPMPTFTGVMPDRQWVSDTVDDYEVHVPLSDRLRVGDRIKSITIYGAAGNVAGEELVARVRRTATTGTDTAISGDKTSSTPGGDVNIGWTTADTDFTPSGHTIVAGAYRVEVIIPQTSVAAEVKLRMVKVVFDHPLV